MIDAPVVTIQIAPVLRAYAAEAAEVTVSGETVADVLESLGREHPALFDRIIGEDGDPLPGIHLHLRGSDVLTPEGLATPVEPEEMLTLLATG